MAKGKVLSIHTCGQASDPMSTHGEVQAIRRQGLRGDRYLSRTGTYSKHHAPDRELTLIESEALEALRREHGITLEPEETRRNLVGSGDRSERIRTYNFTQGRVTDHRINLTLYKLDEVIQGDLDEVIGALTQEYQADQLAALAERS